MDWAYLLAHVTGRVNDELLLRNEYLATENRIFKAQLEDRVLFSDTERMTLAKIGHRLDRKTLEEVANAVPPDTILGWYRKLIARNFDGSKAHRLAPGRQRVDPENVLRRNGIPPAPIRQSKTNWKDFIRSHMAVLTGTDFFSVDVVTLRGLVTYYVLFFNLFGNPSS